jgi:sugar/nucleoside kinase (ribokinase family)
VISGRAQLQTTLSSLSASTGLEAGLVDDVDEVDIRILARSVYQQLLGEEDGYETSSSSSSSSASSLSAKSVVLGKHLLVSMGSRGVLWCGPRAMLLDTENSSISNVVSSASLLENISIENNGSVMGRLSTVRIDPTASKIVSTNGAGDAFCGGLLADIVLNGGKEGGGGFPRERSLRNGLLVAHHRIINGSLQEFGK